MFPYCQANVSSKTKQLEVEMEVFHKVRYYSRYFIRTLSFLHCTNLWEPLDNKWFYIAWGGNRFLPMETGRFAYKSFRLQVDSPTLTSIRLHDLSCFTEVKINKTEAYLLW